MNRKKITTFIIIFATLILAGIAIFTAIRLYQLRQEAVAPTAPIPVPAAQQVSTEDCHTIKFILDYYDQYGRIIRQQANQLRSLDEKYRYLSPNMRDFGDTSTLEGVRRAVVGFYNYYCVQNQPTPTGTPSPTGPELQACKALSFTIAAAETASPTPTPTPTASPTPSPTPTPAPTTPPTGGTTTTTTTTTASTPKPTKTATPAAVAVKTATPAPEEQLPDAGTSWPTIVGAGAGLIILMISLLLAL